MTNAQIVIEKLITKTKYNNLQWLYLCDNKALYNKIFDYLDVATDFIESASFYVNINDGYFVLCEDEYNNLYLVVLPAFDSKDIDCLNSTDYEPLYQQELLRLQNLIKKQFPNVDDFLDDFLNS